MPRKSPKPAPTAAPPAPRASYVPSGRASLIRIERIHGLLSAVTPHSGRRVSLATLAEDLGVARNTVRTDLELLGIFNAPIAYDARRKTLHYTRPFTLRPPLWLQAEEVLALLVAARLAATSRTFPVGRDLVRALEKIAPLLAGAASFGPQTLDPVFSANGGAIAEAEARHFAVLCEAIAHRREVRLAYRKPGGDDGGPERRELHPLHWFLRPDGCLLIAHEPRRGERRNFELMRIQAVEFTGRAFEWPAGFELKRYLAGGFGRFVGEAVCAVRVRIDADYVPFVRERPWQEGQVLVPQPDGSAEAVYAVCHTAELEHYVLRAGGRVQVIDPPDVRERVRAAAAKTTEAHERRR